MAITIVNDGNTIKIDRDGIISNPHKEGAHVHITELNFVIIDPASGLSERIDYNDVTTPTVASAEELREEIVKIINFNRVEEPIQEQSVVSGATNKIDYTVTSGKNLFIQQWNVTFSEGKKYIIELQDDGVEISTIGSGEDGGDGYSINYPSDNPLGPIAAGSVVRLSRVEGDAGKDWAGGFTGFEEDN